MKLKKKRKLIKKQKNKIKTPKFKNLNKTPISIINFPTQS